MKGLLIAAVLAVGLGSAGAAGAQSVVFEDPVGDDRGPGTYVYPSDPVYVRGAFDITRFEVRPGAGYVDFAVTVAADLTNPWRRTAGFSLQFPIVFVAALEMGIDEGLPGQNVMFDMPGWDRAVLMSPQPPADVRREVERRDLETVAIVPSRLWTEGRTIVARVPLSALPEGQPDEWAYQVLMQANDGMATGRRLLMSVVYELEGRHSFGGGDDGDCDPHVIDMLTPPGEDQYAILGDYVCDADDERLALIPLLMAE